MDGINSTNESRRMKSGALGAADFVVLTDGRIIIFFTEHSFPTLASDRDCGDGKYSGLLQQLSRINSSIFLIQCIAASIFGANVTST